MVWRRARGRGEAQRQSYLNTLQIQEAVAGKKDIQFKGKRRKTLPTKK